MDTPTRPRWAFLTTGPKGVALAELLGLDASRVTNDCEVVIPTNGCAVARVSIRLTTDDLAKLVEILERKDSHSPAPFYEPDTEGLS